MEGVPAMCLMESVTMRAGSHKETIQFMVDTKMAETVILELSWLKKWNPVAN